MLSNTIATEMNQTNTSLKKFIGGMCFGFGLLLMFGLQYFVFAQVAPGTIVNPTFSPTANDVVGGVGFDCNIQIGATCPSGYIVTGAGMSCAGGGDNNQFMPDATLTSVSAGCDGANETALAVCCRVR